MSPYHDSVKPMVLHTAIYNFTGFGWEQVTVSKLPVHPTMQQIQFRVKNPFINITIIAIRHIKNYLNIHHNW